MANKELVVARDREIQLDDNYVLQIRKSGSVVIRSDVTTSRKIEQLRDIPKRPLTNHESARRQFEVQRAVQAHRKHPVAS